MIYFSIDVETSGLDSDKNEILQFSMVLEDTNNIKPLKELPHFTCLVRPYDRNFLGSPYALHLNSWILGALAGRTEAKYEIVLELDLEGRILDFIEEHKDPKHKSITVAGKNFAMFDYGFLPAKVQRKIKNRVIDPAILFTDWHKDEFLPDQATCCERAELSDLVTHDAYEDNLQLITLLRKQYT